jgi:hypothetical protein
MNKSIESLVDGLLEVIRPGQEETGSIKDFLIVLFTEYTQSIIEGVLKNESRS